MSKKNLSRRNFISKAAMGISGTALSTIAGASVVSAVANTSMSASSYKRIIGANDRIISDSWDVAIEAADIRIW